MNYKLDNFNQNWQRRTWTYPEEPGSTSADMNETIASISCFYNDVNVLYIDITFHTFVSSENSH